MTIASKLLKQRQLQQLQRVNDVNIINTTTVTELSLFKLLHIVYRVNRRPPGKLLQQHNIKRMQGFSTAWPRRSQHHQYKYHSKVVYW